MVKAFNLFGLFKKRIAILSRNSKIIFLKSTGF